MPAMADYEEQARQEWARLTPEQRRCMIAIATEEFVTSFPYYSKVIFQVAAAEARPGPFTYTFVRGTNVRAFSYAFDIGTAEAAGFPANYIARRNDTNLGKSQETISGETVEMHGLALQLVEAFPPDDALGINSQTDRLSDARLAALCSDAVSVTLQLNAAQQDYKLGIFPMIPGAGGLDGQGNDGLATQAIAGGRGLWGNFYNGRTYMDNYMYLPEGIQWQPAGERDSQLSVLFNFERAVVAFSGGDPDNNATQGADEVPAAGIRGYLYPATIGFGVMVHVKGRVVSLRSQVT